MSEIFLSLDCGTQSLRAMLFDSRGELLAKEQIKYEPYYSIQPGRAEQDANLFWNSLCKACKELKHKQSKLFGKIVGVGITSQRSTVVNVDKNCNPLRPAITWLDQRESHLVYKPNILFALIYRILGMQQVLKKIQIDGKSNWIKEFEPEIWEKTYKFLLVSGFLNAKLTGTFCDSLASIIGHLPFDYKKMRWSKKRELNYKLFPIEREKLPELVNPGSIIGKITKESSKLTGLPRGLPVVACGSDKGCETIGVGVLDQSKASLSFGTTATVQTMTKNYFEPINFFPSYPACLPNHYNPEIQIFRGYWMISWFKKEFGYKQTLRAKKKGCAPESILNELLVDVPAGSMGLMVQPYWGPTLKNPSAKGAMIGFGDVHNKAYVYKAIIEGLAFSLLEGMNSIQKRGKKKIKSIAVSGGASQSDEICQITADIFNLPLYKGKNCEASGLGAAIIISVATGVHKNFTSAINSMVSQQRCFMPNKNNVQIYKQLYEDVYLKLYQKLKPLYKRIRKIINYPKEI